MQYQKIINATEKAVLTFLDENEKEVIRAKEIFLKDYGQSEPIESVESDVDNKTFLFYYWLIFNYENKFTEQFLIKLVPTMKDSFDTLIWSVFEYHPKSIFGKAYLKDILTPKKLIISDEMPIQNLLKSDMFIGRVVMWENHYIILPGIQMISIELKSKIKKLFKTDKKLKNNKEALKANYISVLQNLSAKVSRWNLYQPKNFEQIINL